VLARLVTTTPRRRAVRSAAFATCLAAALLLTVATPGATAQTTGSPASVTQLQAEVDASNAKYFSALAEFSAADVAVRDNEVAVAGLKARAARAKDLARQRALLAYKSSGAGLAAIVDGNSTLDAATRAHLIDRVNARDRSAYKSFRSTAKDLKAKQAALRDARDRQEQSLADLKTQATALDAKLAQAQAQAREQAAVAAAAAASAADTQRRAAADATTTTTTTTVAPPSAPTPPPDYGGTPGTSPHHDDPFLSCVRARESGGNYSAVNPAGPYLGAYQFLQATWNGAAAHAGRMELVGVPANTATPFDQDEVAWSLYQWQGAGPWGGHCP
jgi:peptidoglycan hydrolase CwlO-like protein